MSAHRPEIDSATEAYWAAAADGRLLVERCDDCGRSAPYPRGFCPSCWSGSVGPVEVSGRGTLYSYAVVHANPLPPFAELVPYVAAMVDLEEGPRVLTRLVGVDPAEVVIGMALQATFEKVDEDEGLVLFEPAG